MVDAPDLMGFADAMDRKREAFGEPVRFLWPADRTYPPGTALNASGEPLDPTVDPVTEDVPEVTLTVTVASRTTLASADKRSEQTAVGRLEKGVLMLNLALNDADAVAGAESFERDGERYQIVDSREDGLGPTPNRFLVTGRLET